MQDELLNACVEGSVEDVQKILTEFPELIDTELNHSRWTPLITAVIHNRKDLVRFLLTFEEIDVNKLDSEVIR